MNWLKNSFIDLLDSDFWAEDAPTSPPIDLIPTVSPVPCPALFLPAEPSRPLNKEEKEWVAYASKEAQQNPETLPTLRAAAPTKPALLALEKALSKFSGSMPGTKEEWQNYVMSRYFELASDIDPKISKPALDALAKTNVVGLMEERVEVNINTRSTVELETELLTKIDKILRRQEERVING